MRDYDEALGFFVGKLGFQLVEDSPVPAQHKRGVVIAPPGETKSRLLLARATTSEQIASIGAHQRQRVGRIQHRLP